MTMTSIVCYATGSSTESEQKKKSFQWSFELLVIIKFSAFSPSPNIWIVWGNQPQITQPACVMCHMIRFRTKKDSGIFLEEICQIFWLYNVALDSRLICLLRLSLSPRNWQNLLWRYGDEANICQWRRRRFMRNFFSSVSLHRVHHRFERGIYLFLLPFWASSKSRVDKIVLWNFCFVGFVAKVSVAGSRLRWIKKRVSLMKANVKSSKTKYQTKKRFKDATRGSTNSVTKQHKTSHMSCATPLISSLPALRFLILARFCVLTSWENHGFMPTLFTAKMWRGRRVEERTRSFRVWSGERNAYIRRSI